MIKITVHEFKMIREDYHPDYESKEHGDELGDFYETGKGADIIYQKSITRKEDGAVFVLKTISNTSGGFIHDDPYDCDFEIDYNKEDTIDPYDELKLEERKLAKEKAIEKEKEDKEKEAAKALEISFSLDNPVIPFQEYKDFCKSLVNHNMFSSKGTFQDLQDFLKEYIRPLCKKYNLEANSLFHSTSSIRTKKGISEWLCKYEKAYNKKHSLNKVISVKGEIIEVTEKDIKSILNQLQNKV